jgi:hypothetical protein
MEDLNIPIFAQAKIEYTKQLVDILYPHIYDGVKSIYDEAKVIYSTKTSTPILMLFRELLEKVPIWNSEIIESECSRIIHNSSCDWFDDLITAVFISHTKILTSIGPNRSFHKINVTIPKTTTFVHKSYVNIARELWKNPYLFSEHVPGHEYQRNSKEVENIIMACIETTIRNLLPVKEILREHLDNQENESLIRKDDIKQMLKEELQELRSGTVEDEDDNQGPTIIHETEEEKETTGDISDTSVISDILQELKDTISEGNSLSPDSATEPATEAATEPVTEAVKEPATEAVKEPATEAVKEPVVQELVNVKSYPSLSDDPSEDQVSKNCTDIVVNDITLPVDVETGDSAISSPPLKEVQYDNVDVIQSTEIPDTKKQERMKKLLTMASDVRGKPDISVVKQPTIKEIVSDIQTDPPQMPSFSLNNLYPGMNQYAASASPAASAAAEAVAGAPAASAASAASAAAEAVAGAPAASAAAGSEPPKSPRKEVAEIQKDEINDTDSLAGFLNDVKQIVEDKGVKVDTSNSGMFTLFEDASEIEKN